MGQICVGHLGAGVMYGHQEGSGRILLDQEAEEGGPGRVWCGGSGGRVVPRV